MEIPERYVRLCLRVGRHVDGFVDAYFGPPGWKRDVDDEEPVEPDRLRDEASALLAALDAAGLEDDRTRWLRGQLVALECVTGRLAGEPLDWADEVERCLGVRPSRTDPSVFEAVHRRLDDVLSGSGSVRDRYVRWDTATAIPREKLIPALELLRDVLAPRAHALAPLPADESVAYELVSETPWLAYNWYEGRHRSRVEVNADLPISIDLLVDLVAHEAYPGHHTERTAKDARLHGALGRTETSVVIVLAPEAVISEGIAMNALEQALGQDPFDVVAEALAELELVFDPAAAQAIAAAGLELHAAGGNAAFMLHEDGAPAEAVEAYLREVALLSDEKAARALAFVEDTTWRAYVPAYTEGRRLCRAFAGRAAGNFTRLLTEQLTVADLLA